MNQIENLKYELSKICDSFKFDEKTKPSNIVIDSPYIPYIPDNWEQNKILILFEAQNLSGSSIGNMEYVNELKSSKSKQVLRLYECLLTENEIGISPWDDSYLDFPLKVCFPEHERKDFAVGNAVLWSLSKNEKNLNPTKDLIEKSSQIWKQFLAEMKPKRIVLVGNIAKAVVTNEIYPKELTTHTYFPYGRYPNFIYKHFDFSPQIYRYENVMNALKLLNKTPESPISVKNKTEIKRILPMAISLLLKLKYYNND